jgi:hypothetical protein
MRSGYLLVADYAEALRCFETTPSVRYAAGGPDGRGFVAFDVVDDDRDDWGGLLAAYGAENVFLGQVEANPDDPSTWPTWAKPDSIKCPKRGVATGNEIFVLVLADGGAFTMPDPVTAAAIVTDGNGTRYWLLEFDHPVFVPTQIWRLVVSEYADKRLVSA